MFKAFSFLVATTLILSGCGTAPATLSKSDVRSKLEFKYEIPASWQTYKNDTDQFSFRYPEQWTMKRADTLPTTLRDRVEFTPPGASTPLITFSYASLSVEQERELYLQLLTDPIELLLPKTIGLPNNKSRTISIGYLGGENKDGIMQHIILYPGKSESSFIFGLRNGTATDLDTLFTIYSSLSL